MRIKALIVFLLVMVYPVIISGEEIKGQRPLIIIGESFQFIQGTWARYYVHDKSKKEYYDMSISMLDKEKRDGESCSWMEIEIRTVNNPVVVTRFLTKETPQGPGDLLEVVVQIKGFAPFSVPESFYKDNDNQVGEFRSVRAVRRIDERVMRYSNRALEVLRVETSDQKGKPLTALISKQIPPLGIVLIESQDIEMYLDSWGADARSKIKGTPMNFYLWLMYYAFGGSAE